MRYIRSALFVAVVWLLLSGHYTALILSLGVLSVAIVTWFLWRMDRVDRELGVLPMRPRLMYYLLWLMWQVVLRLLIGGGLELDEGEQLILGQRLQPGEVVPDHRRLSLVAGHPAPAEHAPNPR